MTLAGGLWTRGHPGPGPTPRGPGACLERGPVWSWPPSPWGCWGHWGLRVVGAASQVGLPWSPHPLAPRSQSRLEGRAVSPLACGGPSAWRHLPVPAPAAAGPGAGSGPPPASGLEHPPGGPTGLAGLRAPPRPRPLWPSGPGVGGRQGLLQGPGDCCGSSEGAGPGGGSGDRGGQPGGSASGTRRSRRTAGRPAGSWRVGRKRPHDRTRWSPPCHGGPERCGELPRSRDG